MQSDRVHALISNVHLVQGQTLKDKPLTEYECDRQDGGHGRIKVGRHCSGHDDDDIKGQAEIVFDMIE
jgi:hypothetical protein